jgi:RNA-binding protein YlmH
MSSADHLARLLGAARGGRVASTPFLEPEGADLLAASLRHAGVGVSVAGGRAGARRRVVSAHPLEVPEAGPRLLAFRLANQGDAARVGVLLRVAGVEEGAIGDVWGDVAGVWWILLASAAERMATFQVDGEMAAPVVLAPSERARSRERSAVVPSLRVDALGAKAFGVSREYFAKGIAAGRVRVDGRTVAKSAEAEAGDAVWAEGLGRFRVAEVQGSTRRGNLKVRIEVEFDERG